MAPSGSPRFVCFLKTLLLVLLIEQVHSQLALLPVRTLGLSAQSFFTFDIQFQVPLQLADLNMHVEIDFELPFRIRFMNHTLEYHPIRIPYFVLPEPKPLTFDLTGGSKKPQKYYDYETDPYAYDTPIDQYDSNYYDPDYVPKRSWFPFGSKKAKQPLKKKKMNKPKVSPQRNTIEDEDYYRKYENYGSIKSNNRNDDYSNYDYDMPPPLKPSNFSMDTLRYYHKRHRRDVAEASVQHRLDFFQILEESISTYGLDGRACLCRAICEMAEMEFLIETPLHEVVEHLLRVSRSHDSDGMLSEYIEAEEFGHESYEQHRHNACSKRYAACPFSVFERVFPEQL